MFMSTLSQRLAALTVPVVLLVASTNTAAGWTGPDRVAGLAVDTRPDGPSMVMHDGDRFIAVAGSSGSPGIRLLTDRSGMWRSVRRTDDEAGAPSIAVGGNGAVHIAYARDWFLGCTGRCATPVYHLGRRGGDWHRDRLMGGINVMPAIALDAAGRAHIAVLHRASDGSDWSIQLFSQEGDGWSRQVVDVAVDYGSIDHPNGPSIAIDGDHVAISYLATPTPSTYEVRLWEREGDGPATRSAISHNQRARWADLAFDAAGSLHVAYSVSGGALWHATRDSEMAWGRTRISTHVLEDARPSLVAWGAGKVAIAIEHDPDDAFPVVGSGEIELFTNRQGPWASQLLTHSGSDHLPSLAATSGGHLSVVFVRDPRHAPPTLWSMGRL